MDIRTQYLSFISVPKVTEDQKRGLILISVSVFPLLFSACIFFIVITIGNISFPEKIGHETEYAKITSPVNKSSISEKFSINGTISDAPLDHHFYLFEYREKLYWPKLSLGNKASNWSKELTVYAKKSSNVSYQILMLNKEGKKAIDEWYGKSLKTNKYPGIKTIESAKVVANVKVKTI